MYFNKWLNQQLKGMSISKKTLCEQSGVSYSTLNKCKKFAPRICNLVLICEVLNENRGGNIETLNNLIILVLSW